jgi:hypothetical protein
MSCGSDSASQEMLQSEVVHTHFNILLASDLSNRIDQNFYPRSLDDPKIVGSFLDLIHPTILTHKRSIQQKDKFQMIFTNPRLVHKFGNQLGNLKIDFEEFEYRQADRIAYINGEKSKSLEGDKASFLKTFDSIYDQATQDTHGADLWSFFQNGILDIHIEEKLPDTKLSNGVSCKNEYKNVLILMTDGYLEAGMYGKEHCQNGQCPFLDHNRIEEFRAAYKESGQSDMKAFIKSSDFGITPVNNPNLRELEVIVMEMYDRSLDQAGNATVHPTDYEILQVFWEDWLEESGVKRYSFRPCLSTKEEVDRVLEDFIL